MTVEIFNQLTICNSLVVDPKFTKHGVRDIDEDDPLYIFYKESLEGSFFAFGIIEHLRSDLHEIKQLQLEENDENARFKSRLYIRAMFSLIEACLTLLIALVKKKNEWEDLVGSNKALKQFSPDLRGQLKDRTKHVLRSFNNVYGLDIPIDLNVEQNRWLAYEAGVDIRKSITHPTSLDGLTITIDQASQIVEGWSWFADKFTSLLQAYAAIKK